MNIGDWSATHLSVIFPPMQMYITCALAVAIFGAIVGRGPASGSWGVALSIVTALPVVSVVGCSLVTAYLHADDMARVVYLALNAITVLALYVITVALRMKHTRIPKPPSPP